MNQFKLIEKAIVLLTILESTIFLSIGCDIRAQGIENSSKSPEMRPAMKNNNTKEIPKGWFKSGSNPTDYDMSISTNVFHSGRKCGQLRSIVDGANGFGTLMQQFNASKYRGKRVKFSAFVKSKSVNQWAGLWLRVDAGKKIVSFDNMQERPITGKNDWKEYNIVQEVPAESTTISFGMLLQGPGHVWFDDCKLETVNSDVVITNDYDEALNRSCGIRYQNEKPQNLNFAQGIDSNNSDPCLKAIPKGWFKQPRDGNSYNIELKEDPDEKAKIAVIQSVKPIKGTTTWGALLQAVAAEDFVGKKVRLSGSIKTESVKGSTGLWLRVDKGKELCICHDYMEDRKLEGSTDWNNYECVIEIPPGSDNIYLGAVLYGEGVVLLKNLGLESVSNEVATTGKYGALAMNKKSSERKSSKSNDIPVNLDFADTNENTESDSVSSPVPKGWITAGSHSENYKMYIDSTTQLEGSKCTLIESTTEEKGGFGTLMQSVNPKLYIGKKIQVAAHIKTEDALWAGLWMRVDGQNRKVLEFDNMQDRPITGTTSWKRYECVLDVAEEASNISFGLLLSGDGKAWISKITFNEVHNKIQSTNNQKALYVKNEPVNMSFED